MLDNLQILTAAPLFNLQLVLNGLLVGAVFALAAYGLAVVWGVMNVKNLAQGDFVMLGGYLAYAQQAMNLLFGPEVRTAESGLGTREWFGGIVTVTDIRLVSFVLCAALAAAMVLFMTRSRMGRAIRATAQDPRAARVLGVNVERVYAFTFSLNAAICGAAGVLVAMIWVLQPYYGIAYSVRAFVIVTAAGLGNLPGVIVTALGLGVVEQYGGFVLGAQFQQATVVGLLIVVLI